MRPTTPNKEEAPKFVFNVESDGTIQPHALVRGNAIKELPPGVFILEHNVDRGLYLAPANEFKLPERVYGNINPNVDRFLRSYELNDKNLGVMLVGDAGSGKTLTLKAVVQKGITLDMPAILINQPFPGDMLISFLSTITQPTIVCFDEFDKVYAQTDQNGNTFRSPLQTGVLQLLDGTTTGSKKLFLFSANDEQMINRYMKDRPSRIRYTIKFKRLSLQTVVDYVTTNLKNCTEDHVRAFAHQALSDGVYSSRTGPATGSDGMNFDSMRELVTEMNQFGGDLNESLALMINNGQTSYAAFEINMFKDGVKIDGGIPGQAECLGAYVGKDKLTLKFKIAGAITEEIQQPSPVKIQLTEVDFHAFGATHDVIEFKKDDVLYVLRYIEHSEYASFLDHYSDVAMARQFIQGAGPGGSNFQGMRLPGRGYPNNPERQASQAFRYAPPPSDSKTY